MFPAGFRYHVPETLDEAIRLLQELGPEAKLLAGGHSLIPAMKLRLATPSHIVDLKKVRPQLQYIREEDGVVAVGAMTTHYQVESSDLLKEKVPLLPETASVIGDMQVRNMGTIGGALAHADPAADYPAAVLALEAELVVQGPGGRRTIPASEFFFGFFTTALQPDEVLVEVRVRPFAARTGAAYLKFPHPASGYAVCGVAAVVRLDEAGKVAQCRVGITGVADRAFRAEATEQALEGHAPSPERVAEAAARAAEGIEPLEDYFASADYRKNLAVIYTKRALRKALERAS